MRVEPTGLERQEAHPTGVREAAGQFEALLVAELLKSARGEHGWFGAEDQAGASMLEIAEQHLAGLISANGGLGLADLVVAGLTRSENRDSTLKRQFRTERSGDLSRE